MAVRKHLLTILMTAGALLKYHEGILQLEEYKDKDMANSTINPPNRAVQHWYDQWRLLNLSPRTGQGLIEKLKEKSKIYEEHGITVCLSEEPFAVVIVTPIMLLLCPCSAGAVPVTIIITKGQTQESYRKGFELLNEALMAMDILPFL
ncbi:hypothetical protein AVEN_272700-1 [Araneus ventricosus]|uniref:Uncharacterized protein n=1 Tax=Araneus ventricosus TaxID=182803 RepID=A0A4Y2LAR5_ARAVE|nr:hypothetical protein AVEN_272700-1 [Araneus ventricosus]